MPELGLVRVSNCPLRSKEFLRQARHKRDMQSFNWQLCETVKNVRKYKQKELLFLRAFKGVMNKFHIYDTYIADMILAHTKEISIPKYHTISLKEPDFHMKAETMFGNLKRLGYTDVQLPLKGITDFDMEFSFVKSVKYVSPDTQVIVRDLYKHLKANNVKYKWLVIKSYLNYASPNSTIDKVDYINLLFTYKRYDLFISHCLRNVSLSVEETNIIITWWERIKYSNKNCM
jgi:hypothetical protein